MEVSSPLQPSPLRWKSPHPYYFCFCDWNLLILTTRVFAMEVSPLLIFLYIWSKSPHFYYPCLRGKSLLTFTIKTCLRDKSLLTFTTLDLVVEVSSPLPPLPSRLAMKVFSPLQLLPSRWVSSPLLTLASRWGYKSPHLTTLGFGMKILKINFVLGMKNLWFLLILAFVRYEKIPCLHTYLM